MFAEHSEVDKIEKLVVDIRVITDQRFAIDIFTKPLKELTIIETNTTHMPRDSTVSKTTTFSKTPGLRPFTGRKPSQVQKAFDDHLKDRLLHLRKGYSYYPKPKVEIRYFKGELHTVQGFRRKYDQYVPEYGHQRYNDYHDNELVDKHYLLFIQTRRR